MMDEGTRFIIRVGLAAIGCIVLGGFAMVVYAAWTAPLVSLASMIAAAKRESEEKP
jgi:hypothetical protein